MNNQRNDSSKYVVCVDNSGYHASLELYKIYRVLPDPDAEKDGDLRVIDESGEDYLFAAHRFVFVELPYEITKHLQKTTA